MRTSGSSVFDVRAGAQLVAEGVDDGVLHLEGGEPGVGQGGVVPHGGADRDGVALVEVLAPVDRTGAGVEGGGVGCLEGAQLEQHPHAHPRPEAGTQGLLPAPLEGHAAGGAARPADAEIDELARGAAPRCPWRR